MTVTCPTCGTSYDDAERWTICPHDRLMAPAQQAQKDLALSLFGKDLMFASGLGGVVRVQSVGWDGMVTLYGWSGEFAPHLFRELGFSKT